MDAIQFKSFQSFQEKPYAHPFEAKVILKVNVHLLGLKRRTVKYLIAIAGPRVDPASSVLKMAGCKYPTVIENKRYLLEQLQSLVKEAIAMEAEFKYRGVQALQSKQ